MAPALTSIGSDGGCSGWSVIRWSICVPRYWSRHALAPGYTNVELVEGDVTRYRPAELVDCVFFSYALTMIDDWQAALTNAMSMLKPGGTLGVVGFSTCPHRNRVPASYVTPGGNAGLWRRWFAHDAVRLSPAHLEALTDAMPDNVRLERQGALPYLPGLNVPYYLFIGRKAGGATVTL